MFYTPAETRVARKPHKCSNCGEELADVKASLEQAESENNALRAALYDEHYGITHTLRVALFEDALRVPENMMADAARWRYFADSPQTALMLGSELDPHSEQDWITECNRLADSLMPAN